MNLILIITIFFPLLFISQEEREIKFESKVNKNRIKMGEYFTYTLTISSNYKTSPKVKLPNFSDFIIVSSQRSSNYNLKIKRHEMIIKYEIRLLPKRVGLFFIEPAQLIYNNKTYKSNALKIEVLPSPELEEIPKEKKPFKKKEGVIL